jgi:hypothetical protein
MKLSSLNAFLVGVAGFTLVGFACAQSQPFDLSTDGSAGTGGSTEVTTGSGGSSGTGGITTSGSGGVTSTGGTTATSTGGSTATSTGGSTVTSTGGATGTGGTTTSGSGGMFGTGGSTVTGTGGATGTGGSTGSGTGGVTGLGGAKAGTGGVSGGAGASGVGGASGGTATFAAVTALFATNCVPCHNGMKHTDLRAAGLYARIVNASTLSTLTTNAMCTSQKLIVPNSPAMSLISNKVHGTNLGGCGARMPYMCSTTATMPAPASPPACLTTAQIATIDGWISAGAPM